MTISFAGLSIVSLQNPFTELASLVVGKGDIRTMICLLVFCIVSLVLAYLTNPSENSFRAYLTEQSFRQHLSRLDENSDDVNSKLGEGASRLTLPRSANPVTSHILPFDGTSPFHFANRASISLRTPKHVFHSFGVFTVAAMIPLSKSSIRDDRNGLMISDSWYIGAFGKWWRGGVLETWYQDVISRSKDEESWSSGILSMKNLDMLQDFTGPVAKLGLSGGFVHGSPPKLRNRERAACKTSVVAPRSSSPPPLPKTASLPLHTTRALPTASERTVTLGPHSPPAQPLQQCNASDSTTVGTPPSRSPSTIFDQSPRIALVLEQISTSKASIVDLRAQLLDCQTSTSQTHTSLQEELNTYRERKRLEDASKLETKSRTKALEDSKRSAEALKREADKRFRTAQTAHENATQRIQLLGQEIEELKEQTLADEESLQQGTDDVTSAERDLSEEVERKKQEIKNTEDILSALNQRVRELEEQLHEEREKLRNKQSLVENRKAKRAQSLARGSSWASAQNGFMDSGNVSLEPNGQSQLDGFTTYRPHLTLNNAHLAFDSASVIGSDQAPAVPMSFGHAGVGYSLASFEDEVSRTLGLSVASPTGQSLIPSGLITSLDGADNLGTSRSFQRDDDAYLEKEWRNKSVSFQSQGHERTYDPFCASPSAIAASSTFPPSKRSSLDGHGYPGVYESGNGSMEEREFGRWSTELSGAADSYFEAGHRDHHHHKASTRRWFPTLPKDKSKKGLNPDAKEFSMALGPTSNNGSKAMHHSVPSFDNLNPTGIGGTSSMSTSTTTGGTTTTSETFFLRAFAPSPAEREALQRALGGANTSFERLPSLSDVGSIPSSPSHIHALPMPIAPPNSHVHHGHGRGAGANKLQLPSWFSRGRKTQFSPWGDEEPATNTNTTSTSTKP